MCIVIIELTASKRRKIKSKTIAQALQNYRRIEFSSSSLLFCLFHSIHFVCKHFHVQIFAKNKNGINKKEKRMNVVEWTSFLSPPRTLLSFRNHLKSSRNLRDCLCASRSFSSFFFVNKTVKENAKISNSIDCFRFGEIRIAVGPLTVSRVISLSVHYSLSSRNNMQRLIKSLSCRTRSLGRFAVFFFSFLFFYCRHGISHKTILQRQLHVSRMSLFNEVIFACEIPYVQIESHEKQDVNSGQNDKEEEE